MACQGCWVHGVLWGAGREREEELARLIAQPFKLVGGGVPLRVYLLAEDGAAGRAVLLFSAHHAIRCASSKCLP